MNNDSIYKNKNIQCGLATKYLSIFALVFITISSITTISFSLTCLQLVPCILFLFYIFKYHHNYKATIMIPIIFGLIPLGILLKTLIAIIFQVYLVDVDGITFVLSILATISALKGFHKKALVTITMAAFIFKQIVMIIVDILYATTWGEPYYIFSMIGDIGITLFYIALLLFALKNRIPVLLKTSKRKQDKPENPEQELKELNDKLEFGMITEEEYQNLRTEIINNL